MLPNLEDPRLSCDGDSHLPLLDNVIKITQESHE